MLTDDKKTETDEMPAYAFSSKAAETSLMNKLVASIRPNVICPGSADSRTAMLFPRNPSLRKYRCPP